MSAAPSAASPSRRPLDGLAYWLMLLLCVTWGFQQVAVKLTAQDMPPVLQLATRFAGSALVFAVLVGWRERGRVFADGTLRSGLLVGGLFALEFLFVAESLKYTTAAHAIVFLYTAPVFAALGLQFLPEERLAPVQWAGIGLAIVGIALAFLNYAGRPDATLFLGDGLGLAAGIVWGASTVALRRSKLAGAMATKTVAYQVSIAALLLGLYAGATGQWHATATPRLVASLVFQTLGIAVLSYLGWFWLLRHYLTSRLMLLALMTPLFGVVLGAVVLKDPIDARFALGSLLVLGGIVIVNGFELLKARG